MGKLRTGIWILVLILLMVLFFQNQAVFLSSRTLQLNLYFVKYQTPQLPDGLFFLATLLIGLLISYLFSLGERFKAKRVIKSLSATLDARQQEVTRLKKEIEDLKRVPTPEPPPMVAPPAADIEKPLEPERPIELPAEEIGQTESEKTDETVDSENNKGVES